ncbi:MAG TPA: diacylglycerol kinase family protein [Ramlibacter sp.]|nr:diacylglycerol kinase family protein [Ramlibacter sp.]
MSALPTAEQAAEFAAAADLAHAEFFVVINPGSGARQADEKRAAIEAALAEAGRKFRFVPVEPGQIVAACQQAAQQAAQEGGVLVAVGGDGTLNAGAQAALTHGCPFGAVAQGTFNMFAREHGLPLDAAEAARALATARPEPVQVGLVNQHIFLVNAAVGLYPKLLQDRETVNRQLGRRRNWINLITSVVSLFDWRLQLRLEVELDGEVARLRTPSLFVCNNRLQLDRVGIEEQVVTQVGRGRLAALVARPMGVAGKLKVLWRAAWGRLGEGPELDSRAMRSLAVTTRGARRIKVSTDGEVQWMQLPLRFAVSPQPLMLMRPAVPE